MRVGDIRETRSYIMDSYKELRDDGLVNPENIIVSPEIKTIPMVALRGKVILPNVFTSFDVGRLKSLAAINASVDTDEALIFVSAQRDAKVEEPSEKTFATSARFAE